MKSCAYCGQQNEDAAVVCTGCGTSEFQTAPTSRPTPSGSDTAESDLPLWGILNDPIRLFRALVIAATVSYLIWFFHLLLGERLISQEVWDALAWDGYGALLPFPPKFEWLFMLL